jgi:hypothetical protein
MRAYSQDFRDRRISDVSSEECTQAGAAEKISISLLFVQKLWLRWRKPGDTGWL